MIRFEADFHEFLKKLDPVTLQKAQKSTLSRMRSKTATRLSKGVRSKYTLTAGTVREALSKRLKLRIEKDHGEAWLMYIGTRIGMINFKGQFKKVRSGRGPRQGATAKLFKGERRKLVPGGFIAQGKGGNTQIFRRASKSQKSRFPIIAVKGPSVPQMIGQEEVLKDAEQFVREEYPNELVRQIDYQMSKL